MILDELDTLGAVSLLLIAARHRNIKSHTLYCNLSRNLWWFFQHRVKLLLRSKYSIKV